MKTIAIAATVLTLGLSSYSLPAFALADDYGQFAWTEKSQSHSAPAGQSLSGGSYRATIDFGSRAAVAPSANSVAPQGRSGLYSRIDSEHNAW